MDKTSVLMGSDRFRSPLGIHCEFTSEKAFQKWFIHRWALQRVFQIVASWEPWDDQRERKQRLRHRVPNRVCHCLTTPKSIDGSVAVKKRQGKEFAHYSDLQTCGSVWSCPLCAQKISDERVKIINRMSDAWFSESPDQNINLMGTYTIPHKSNQSYLELRERLGEARRLLKKEEALKKSVRSYKKILSDIGSPGSLYAFEATWGPASGWHPHTHDLIFCTRSALDGSGSLDSDIRADLSRAWLRACLQAGVDIPSYAHFLSHAVKLDLAKSPADYISKWGIESYRQKKEKVSWSWGAAQEMAKNHLKRHGAADRFSVWEMPEQILAHPGDRDVFNFFGLPTREFIQVQYGKNQLRIDRGLKKRFGIIDRSEDFISESESESEIETLGHLIYQEWKLIKRLKIRGEFLVLSGKLGFDNALEYINQIKSITKEFLK